MHAGDKTEFAEIDAQGRIFDLLLKQAAGKICRRQPVRLGHFADVVGRGKTAAAAHVLHGDRRLAGNVLGQMLAKILASMSVGPPGPKLITTLRVLP